MNLIASCLLTQVNEQVCLLCSADPSRPRSKSATAFGLRMESGTALSCSTDVLPNQSSMTQNVSDEQDDHGLDCAVDASPLPRNISSEQSATHETSTPWYSASDHRGNLKFVNCIVR